MKTKPKQGKAAIVAGWAARGAGFAWLACAYFVRVIVEPGPRGYSEPQGLFHIPTKADCVLLVLGAVAGAVYAAIQLARGKEP